MQETSMKKATTRTAPEKEHAALTVDYSTTPRVMSHHLVPDDLLPNTRLPLLNHSVEQF
jgi:hypothetical protein